LLPSLATGFDSSPHYYNSENPSSKHPLNNHGKQPKYEDENAYLSSAVNLHSAAFTSQDLCQSGPWIADSRGVQKREPEEHLSKYRLNRSPSLELFYFNKPENNQERGNQTIQAILESLSRISCNHVPSNLKLHPQSNQSSAKNLYVRETFGEIPLKAIGFGQATKPY